MALTVLLWSAWLSSAQFDEDKPPEKCPAFECKAGQRPVGKYGIITARGCPDGGGISMFNAGSFDPNDPMGSMKKQNSQSDKVHKCCVERDICRSTCGMDAEKCHADFQKCSNKVCKGDKNCKMMSSLSDILGSANLGAEKLEDESPGCSSFRMAQQNACKCVKEDEWQPAVDKHVTKFFKKYNKEKLNSEGTLKDPDSVWDKWRGKEPDMFYALYSKYKDKAVTVPPKPKRDDPFGGFGGMPPPPPKKEKKENKKEPKAEEASDAEDGESGFDEDL